MIYTKPCKNWYQYDVIHHNLPKETETFETRISTAQQMKKASADSYSPENECLSVVNNMNSTIRKLRFMSHCNASILIRKAWCKKYLRANILKAHGRDVR